MLDVGPAGDQLIDHPIEFFVSVGEAGEIAFLHDRGGESGFGEDHHAGGRLDEVGAGPRSDHEEERILDLAMEPDDAGQSAEHFALAALAQNGALRGKPWRSDGAGAGRRVSGAKCGHDRHASRAGFRGIARDR